MSDKDVNSKQNNDKSEYGKNTQNRVSRTLGHLSAVKRMIDEGRDSYDVLVQLSAVKAELSNISKQIVKERLEEDLEKAAQSGDQKAIENLSASIDKLLF